MNGTDYKGIRNYAQFVRWKAISKQFGWYDIDAVETVSALKPGTFIVEIAK